jgi:hypothetical protein
MVSLQLISPVPQVPKNYNAAHLWECKSRAKQFLFGLRYYVSINQTFSDDHNAWMPHPGGKF